ncbi:MAG: hypothetical protein K2I10_12935 [Lachnospiraceae bacterium]|nr:hypothetical protein [Lachnospiraceae bacterium]
MQYTKDDYEKIKKLLCTFGLALVIAFSHFGMLIVYASQSYAEEKSYEDMLKQVGQTVSEGRGTQGTAEENIGSTMEVNSLEELFNGVSWQIMNHKEVMYYDTNINFNDVFDKYYIHYNEKDPLMSGMYMVYFVSEWQLAWWEGGKAVFSGKYKYRYEIKIAYRCSEKEMADFFVKTKNLAEQLRKPTEFESVKAVHDYICENVTYDHTYRNYLDLEGFRDGTMVCNGYSMAMFNLLSNMGINCRIVTGMANSQDGTENHAWNVIRVDGKWYNTDATWDDLDNKRTPVSYNYFLKSDYDFPMHTRLSRYDGYTRSMAAVSYPEPKAKTRFAGDVAISTIVFTGVFLYVIIKLVADMNADKQS